MSGVKIWRTLEVLEKEGNKNVNNERETLDLERERERESNGQLQINSLWFGGFSLCLPLF